jgi:hypothetical protein
MGGRGHGEGDLSIVGRGTLLTDATDEASGYEMNGSSGREGSMKLKTAFLLGSGKTMVFFSRSWAAMAGNSAMIKSDRIATCHRDVFFLALVGPD